MEGESLVPADCRVIKNDITVVRSNLTRYPGGIRKCPNNNGSKEDDCLEAENLVFLGSKVESTGWMQGELRGKCVKCVVIRTGDASLIYRVEAAQYTGM